MKPTESLCAIAVRRATLSTKRAGKGYYKGTRTGSMGDHTKHGKYIIDWNKVRTYVVPKDLKDFKVCQQIQVIEKRPIGDEDSKYRC